MKLEVEQIDMEKEEEVIVRCHDVEADWVGNVKDAAMGQLTVCGYKDNVLHRLWHLIDFGISAKTASEINEKIRERRLERREKIR